MALIDSLFLGGPSGLLDGVGRAPQLSFEDFFQIGMANAAMESAFRDLDAYTPEMVSASNAFVRALSDGLLHSAKVALRDLGERYTAIPGGLYQVAAAEASHHYYARQLGMPLLTRARPTFFS